MDAHTSYHAGEVAKSAYVVPMSDEMLADAREMQAAMLRWMTATPEERAQWAREADERNQREREQAEHVPLTLDALIDRMGWTREYAEHLVQPYCECYDGYDGWEYCQHARDLGLTPGG